MIDSEYYLLQLGAVRSLLALIVEDKWKEMHPCALRALTVLTSVPTAIRSFEEVRMSNNIVIVMNYY